MMGVKSTVFLTREEAERRYADFCVESLKPTYVAFAATLSASSLERELMNVNDLLAGGEGFENYIIRDNGEDHGGR